MIPRMGIFQWVEDLGPVLPLGDRVKCGTTQVVWEVEGIVQGLGNWW